MKKKNVLVTTLSMLGLLSITLGVSMAFFNYTKIGNENVLSVGKIYFTSSQGTAINLTNVFPVKRTEIENNSNVGSVTLTIRGDTTYDEGIEYLVSASDVVNTVSSKQVPIGVSVSTSSLGNSDDSYFENRGGNTSLYKILSKGTIKENGELVVGYITKGASGVNGTVTIKAWIDGDKIAISDTYDGTESDNMGTTNEWVDDREVFTTTEWNSLQSNGLSFKLKVEANEGIWVKEPLNALETITKNVNTTTLINFANPSSDTNGKGVYILPGTESDTHPIYYYRGAVDNNNVVFGGFCWQIVRTTDTGGIKMIYNGLPDISGSGNNIIYNCGTTRNIQDTIRTTTSLSQSTGYYYADDYEIVSTSGNSVTYRLKSKTNPITQVAIADATAAATNIPTIATNYPYTCKQTTDSETCTTLYKVDSYASGKNANVYASTDRTTIGRYAFNSSSESISDVGYMSNTRYPYSIGVTTGAIYGKDIEWNGSTYLVIEDAEGMASTNETKNNDHHYSCGTTGTTSCSSVRYYYYNNYYIILSSGDTIEDALYKMTGNGSQETKTKNASYVLNQNNSTAKTAIDNWFRANLTSEVDTNNSDYSVYLEDAVFCNDRSYKTTGSSNTYTQSGWNFNGGELTTYLSFGTHNRYSNSWYSTSNVPTVKNVGEVPNIACPNESDRFTVSSANGNGALTYPVGLLTADEIILAGVGGNAAKTTTYYLYTSNNHWSLTPYYFSEFSNAHEFYGSSSGSIVGFYVHSSSYGLRPVISLKPGIEFLDDGDGTATNPYIVKYN